VALGLGAVAYRLATEPPKKKQRAVDEVSVDDEPAPAQVEGEREPARREPEPRGDSTSVWDSLTFKPSAPHEAPGTSTERPDPTRAPVDVATPPLEATRTPSGLAYRTLRVSLGKGSGLKGPGLKGPRDAEVLGLVLRELGQLHAELLEVERGDLLVELLREDVHAEGELLAPEGHLREHLVGERAAHHERRVAVRAAEVHEAAAREDDEALAVGEDELVHLRLDVLLLDLGVVLEPRHLDLAVEVADVAEDGAVLHGHHVLAADDVLVASRGDDDVGEGRDLLHRLDLVALHRGLERADRVDLGDDDAGAEAAERLRAALAHVAVAAHDGRLAGEHDARRALEAVAERLAATVEVVELALGDGVVDVHRRDLELALLVHLVEAVHARRRLLAQAADRVGAGEELGVLLVDPDGEIPTVVQDHVRALAALEGVDLLLEAPVVLLQRLALPREDGDAGRRDRRGRVVLRRVDVAARPGDLGAERHEGLDEDGGLDGHVEAARDAGAGEGLLGAVLLRGRP
jgi:hypothetical protein